MMQNMIQTVLNTIRNRYRVQILSRNTRYKVILVPTYRCSLGCHFCFIKGLEGSFPADMRPEDVEKFLVWMRRNRLDCFLLSGGEPTEYRYFKELMQSVSRYDMQVVIASNNLYPEDLHAYFSRRHVRFFLLNYTPQILSVHQKRRFEENVRELRKRCFTVALKVNMYSREYDRASIDLAAAYGCSIFIAFSCPGYGHNTYVLKEETAAVSRGVMDFMRECKKKGVRTNFSRPIIPCVFTADEISALKPAAVRYRCTPIPVVNPDLTLFPCLNIFKRYPAVTSFSGVSAIHKAIAPHFNSLRGQPLYEQCGQCRWYRKKECQGGCLSYKKQPEGIY